MQVTDGSTTLPIVGALRTGIVLPRTDLGAPQEVIPSTGGRRAPANRSRDRVVSAVLAQVVPAWVVEARQGVQVAGREEKIGSEAAISLAAAVEIATPLVEEREGTAGRMLERVAAAAPQALDPGAEAGSAAEGVAVVGDHNPKHNNKDTAGSAKWNSSLPNQHFYAFFVSPFKLRLA